MSQDTTHVAVLIVSHNGWTYLEACLSSILNSVDPGLEKHVIVVDNASTDGTPGSLRSHFPQVHLIECGENLGFAEGNNLGWQHIQRAVPQAQSICLLNQDTRVASGWLVPLVDDLNRHRNVAAVQPKILLAQDASTINTVGNRSHYLGYTFMTGYGERDAGQYDEARSINCASGAAMLIRCDDLNRVGLFDREFFMYAEDVDLCWKFRQLGRDICYVPASVVFHEYTPTAPLRHYGSLERNRWLLLLTYYKLPTLLLLAPALLSMEIGQWIFSSGHGLLGQKLRAYAYFLNPRNLAKLWRRRREAQQRRTIGDREFLSQFAGTIDFPPLDSPLLQRIGNPMLNAFWRVARKLLLW